MKKTAIFVPVFLAVVLVLCCCLVIILSAAYFSFTKIEKTLPTLAADIPFSPDNPTPTYFEITRQPVDQAPIETMRLLEQTVIPGSSLAELACRFKGVCGIAPTLAPPVEPLSIGAKQSFWINDEDTNSYFRVDATLQYITLHSYFWVADNTRFSQSDVKDLMDAFESQIYPTDREFFGSEWTPGVDDDPHIYILYTSGLGASVGGYFYSPDEYPPQIFQYSNAHEMFYVSSSEPLSNDYTYGTLAHELQHMIHWYQDRNETTFLNEGFSELATLLNGYSNGYNDLAYLADPDLNLTDWLSNTGDNGAHYGASFLFVTYFLDRFGEDTTKALVHDQQNGLDSLDETLSQKKITDPLTGKIVTADDFFLDWTITNYLQDGSVSDGRYTYHNYPIYSKAETTDTITTCPMNSASRTVNQYGVDYIRIECPGSYSLHFEGATTTQLVPSNPHSGSYAFWSNKGDESDMTLTHSFDLTGVSGPIAMDYWTWYDIEKDFDYVYVETSTDGQHWDILTTPSGTASNPNGASYGWAYTGQSDGWIQESIDLSQFVGKTVYVRFEYITDPALNGEGILLDDISIPAINYSTDFENGEDGWQAAGFVRIQNVVPQTFRLALITHSTAGADVQIIPVLSDQSADIPINIGQNGVQDVTLVVTGTTRFTRVIAPYQFSIH